MKKRFIPVLTAIAALLGAAHVALTAVIYPAWNLEALWFLGAGLAMLLAAGVNVMAHRSSPQSPRAIPIVSNAAMAVFFASAWPLLQGPQVALGGAVFLSLTMAWLWQPKPADVPLA